MDRRKFLKSVATAAAVTAVTAKLPKTLAAQEKPKTGAAKIPDLVAVRNGEPVAMFRKGIEALGGMKAFVKPGQKVVVKPNASFDAPPERGNNTDPGLIGEIVAQALAAGAAEVAVFDHTLNEWRSSYKNSGIEAAVIKAGGKMLPANEEKFYETVKRPQALKHKENKVFKTLLEADVFINVPKLKNHGGAKMSCAIKNLMGVVWERHFMHRNDLDQCIAEGLLYAKPHLNVVDAYRMLIANGPRGVSEDDVELTKYMLLSADIVAADAVATQVIRYKLEQVPYIKIAEKLGFGQSDISKLNISRLEA